MLEGEPLLSPEVARNWVTHHHKVTEVDGELIVPGDVPHTCIAGIIIASGEKNRYLSEVYEELPHHRGPLSDEVLLRMAKLVAETYEFGDSDIEEVSLESLESELIRLRHLRGKFDNRYDWSRHARDEAVAKIDVDIVAIEAQIDQLQQPG